MSKKKKKLDWRCKHGYLISRDKMFVCSKCREENEQDHKKDRRSENN